MVTPSRPIITVPDPWLRHVCQPVERIDSYIKDVVNSMREHLGQIIYYDDKPSANIGLAAPQLGVMLRLFLVSLRGIEWVVINPEIAREQGKQMSPEFCESIPGKWYWVERPKLIKVRGLDLEGNPHTYKGHDLLAAVLRHEYDHMDGVLICDKGTLGGER